MIQNLMLHRIKVLVIPKSNRDRIMNKPKEFSESISQKEEQCFFL